MVAIWHGKTHARYYRQLGCLPNCSYITQWQNFRYSNYFFLFLVGLWSTGNYIQHYKAPHDPKEVVIDEVVGQLLTVLLVSILLEQEMNSSVLLVCFFSFRFFDIIKVWPINLIDKNTKGPLGIMLDDVVAAILAFVFIGAFYCLLLIYAE